MPIPLPRVALTAWQVLLGCIPLLGAGLGFERAHLTALPLIGWVALAYTAFISMGMCYLLWFAASQEAQALERRDRNPSDPGCRRGGIGSGTWRPVDDESARFTGSRGRRHHPGNQGLTPTPPSGPEFAFAMTGSRTIPARLPGAGPVL